MRVSSSTIVSPRLLSAPVSLAFDRPPRDAVLGTLLAKGTVAHLRGPRGAGKIALALEIADAVARGGRALMWSAPRPRRVLFLHAGMPPAPPPNLDLMPIAACAELAERAFPLAGYDLIVVDGFAAPAQAESARCWRLLARAVKTWREHGLAVVLASAGAPHGLDEMIDVTIGVTGSAEQEGRAPGFHHILVEPSADPSHSFAEACFKGTAARGPWRVYTREHADLMRISGLTRAGFSVREIACRLGTSESRVQQLLGPADRHARTWIAPRRRQSTAQSSQSRPAIRENSDAFAVTSVAPRHLAWPAINTS